MSNVAIRVENLGKMYRIGGQREKYRTFRDVITNAAITPFRRAGHLLKGQAYGASDRKEAFWALRDVSFEIKHGEVVGIIGRNGAGKSTLLKVLSRITEPTVGYADIYGRVGALLEVGTGFHEELTGRENIYLNGAILGMSRVEMERRFDEIVDFAGVEKFIDTPVKHFSSGMKLRLGFAVAAHLEPEILVVDEVLAVGDAEFQKKCLDKMSAVARVGRTVLFVSHNLPAILSMCDRAIYLSKGQIIEDGKTDEIVSNYIRASQNLAMTDLSQRLDRIGNGKLRFERIWINDHSGNPLSSIDSGNGFVLMLEYSTVNNEELNNIDITITVEDAYGQSLIAFDTGRNGQPFPSLKGKGTLSCRVSSLPLIEDTYGLKIHALNGKETYDLVQNALQLVVNPSRLSATSQASVTRWHGFFRVPYEWKQI